MGPTSLQSCRWVRKLGECLGGERFALQDEVLWGHAARRDQVLSSESVVTHSARCVFTHFYCPFPLQSLDRPRPPQEEQLVEKTHFCKQDKVRMAVALTQLLTRKAFAESGTLIAN